VIAEILRIFEFSRWRLCLPRFWTAHEAYLVVFTGVQNLVDRRSSMKLWIFCMFGLKMPIHDPKITVFWEFDPWMGRYINRTPKRHILAWKDVIWHIDRQNRSTGATCARAHETKKTKKPYGTNTVKNWVFAQTTHVVRSKYRLAWWDVVCRQEL